MNSPAFQFYAADWLADARVQAMSLEAEGIYIRLLCYCWREGSIPNDRVAIARLCKGYNGPAIDEALSCFVPMKRNPGRLINKRLNEERQKQSNYHKSMKIAGLAGAKKRWGGHSQANGQAKEKPIAKNSSSSSSSSSIKKDLKRDLLVPFRPHHLDLARFLEAKIKENVPFHKFTGVNYLESWAREFRLMEDRDKVPFDAIKAVLEWAVNDEFWRINILSAGTFREKFGRLAAKMKGTDSRAPDPPRVGANIKPGNSPEYWAERNRLKEETGLEGRALMDALNKKAREGKG